MEADSPDLAIAKRLLDELKLRGFEFRRAAPGVDAPLVGNRINGDSVDHVHIAGVSRDCSAWRQRTSSLIVPGGALVERRVEGSALDVLNEMLTWEMGASSDEGGAPVSLRVTSSRTGLTISVGRNVSRLGSPNGMPTSAKVVVK